MGERGPDPTLTPDDVLEAFIDRGDPAAPLTAQEAADILDVAKRTAHKHLQRTVEESVLESKRVGGQARVWWIPYDEIPSQESTNGDRERNDSDDE
jgi:hypothetical protein